MCQVSRHIRPIQDSETKRQPRRCNLRAAAHGAEPVWKDLRKVDAVNHCPRQAVPQVQAPYHPAWPASLKNGGASTARMVAQRHLLKGLTITNQLQSPFSSES